MVDIHDFGFRFLKLNESAILIRLGFAMSFLSDGHSCCDLEVVVSHSYESPADLLSKTQEGDAVAHLSIESQAFIKNCKVLRGSKKGPHRTEARVGRL